MLIILIFRVITLTYYPFPEDLTWLEKIDMNQYLKSLPDGAFIVIITSHVLGAFSGALIAALISLKTRFTTGIITGAIIFIVVIIFNFSFDFPVIYLMISTLLTALAGFGGSIVGNGRKV